MEFIFTTIVLYVATSMDDTILLLTWFSQCDDSSLKPSQVVIGQYVGFIGLLSISAIGAFGAFVIPQEWTGLLGLVPIYLGCKALVELYKERAEGKQDEIGEAHTDSNLSVSEKLGENPKGLQRIFHPNIYKVAAVTFANGGNNIAVYIPYFSMYEGWKVAIIIITFLILVAIWCYIPYKLVKFPLVAKTLGRYGHIIVPFVLIGLGIFILNGNGTISYFINKLL